MRNLGFVKKIFQLKDNNVKIRLVKKNLVERGIRQDFRVPMRTSDRDRLRNEVKIVKFFL